MPKLDCVSCGNTIVPVLLNPQEHYERYGNYCRFCTARSNTIPKYPILKPRIVTDDTELARRVNEEMREHIEEKKMGRLLNNHVILGVDGN